MLSIDFVIFVPSGSLLDSADVFGFPLWSDAVSAQTDTDVTWGIFCCVPDGKIDRKELAGSMSSDIFSWEPALETLNSQDDEGDEVQKKALQFSGINSDI